MELRVKPIFRIGNRPSHFFGGDRRVMIGFGTMGALLVMQGNGLLSRLLGVALWCFGIWYARSLVQRDPYWLNVWAERRTYNGLYLARSTPFRVNSPRQAGRYR